MQDRIRRLTQGVLEGRLYPYTVAVEYDRADLLLPPVAMSAKRVAQYIRAQKPVLTEDSALTGFLRFDDSVEGDVFTRAGHRNFAALMAAFYNKPLNNLATFEWQHSTADYSVILKDGLAGIFARLAASRQAHERDAERLEFVDALETVAQAIVSWAEKCAGEARQLAGSAGEGESKARLEKLAAALERVPLHPAGSFYEAVLSIYVTYSFVPDSLGTLDRYLLPFYEKDMAEGKLTRDEATAYLQELFLMLQGRMKPDDVRFNRGGESHFCVGGYTADGEDGFTDLSRLIVEAMLELPTWVPQLSLRWTAKTPREVLRYMMDRERHDANKRIAFVNDEPRIRALMQIVGLPFEQAVRYTMLGCNELALPGGIMMGSAMENILLCVERTVYGRAAELPACRTYDEFYAVFRQELHRLMEEIVQYEDAFNLARARDVNLVSSLFLEGCIENAQSVTRGGCTRAIAQPIFIGISNVIDSLSVIRQFVYEEKQCTMAELLEALRCNWEGHEDLRTLISKKARFFGNHDALSDGIARQLTSDIYAELKDHKSVFGYSFLVGNLIGYNQHNKWFGSGTRATPDGRHDADMIQFGIGQSEGKDRSGLTPLLASIATCDPNGILCGSSVTNVMLDQKLIRDDELFEKTVLMMETYFRQGGIHFQLNYVSPEELKEARLCPQKYKSLRVRVSGFSDYFVALDGDLQDEIVTRTEHAQ